MPWSIKKRDGKFCVVKEGETKPIPGGCHDERAEAVDQLQALYASEAMSAIADSFTIDDSIESEDVDTEEVEALTAAFTLTEHNWSGPIVFEGVETGDKRKFSAEAISWDNPPLPLLFQRKSGEGHSGSVVIGRVDSLERKGDTVFAKGVILEGIPEADEFLALMEHGAAGGVSVDGDSAQYTVEQAAVEGGQPTIQFNGMRIRGLTAVAIPAFSDAEISLDLDEEEEVELAKRKKKKMRVGNRAMTWKYAQEAGIVASAAPVRPPLQWFDNPQLEGPTPMTITEDGYVYGHLALWGTCHIGMPSCTTPPKGGSYNYFHTGEVETEDGVGVAVGHLTFNTGHASVYSNAADAASHYDNTGYVGADVVTGEDKHGIWFAGALRPELSPEQVRTFRAAPLSGDWRRIGGKMELVAALSVNTPGFPVPRTKALVASASLDPETIITFNEGDFVLDMKDRKDFKSFLGNKVRTIFADDPCKSEGDAGCFPAGDYAYVPDASAPSTWKLRLTATPGGDPDRGIVGAALAALGKGFRGNKVEIPEADLAAVKKKVKAAWLAANKGTDKETPKVVAASDSVELAHMHEGGEDYDHEDDLETAIYHLKIAKKTADPETLRHVNEALAALERENAYDDEDLGDDDEDYEYSADTEEFASCTSARKRVRNARRSLRKALRALRNCTGIRVVVVNPTPPASGMSSDIEVFNLDAVVTEFCESPDGKDHAVLAATVLDDAIKLHEAHMNGDEPADEDSQKKLMELITAARQHLSDEEILHEDERSKSATT